MSWEDVEKELDMRSLKLKRRPGGVGQEEGQLSSQPGWGVDPMFFEDVYWQ